MVRICLVCGKILADISNTADKPTFAEVTGDCFHVLFVSSFSSFLHFGALQMHLHGKRIKKPGTDYLESYERTSITRGMHFKVLAVLPIL